VNVIQEIETRLPEQAVGGFRRLIGQARVGDPILLQERAMARMVVQATWILTRVGADGIRLTKAGHLPPAVIVEASAELDWGWPISVNREVHLRPLQELRGHLRDVGLLRVSKGMLVLTVKGRALAQSPRKLWWHLARTIHHSRTPAVSDATRLLLLFVATRGLARREDYLTTLARALGSLGWVQSDGQEPTTESVWHLVDTKWRLLDRLGAFEQTEAWHGDRGTVTAGGAAFARAALQSDAPTHSPGDS
jgi:hypothetical protein